MKKIAILFSIMCLINTAYAMREKTQSGRRPQSIELGSYFLYLSYLGSTNAPLYFLSEEWQEHSGKMADKILPLSRSDDEWLLSPKDRATGIFHEFDDAFIARHEELAGSICPVDYDEEELWKEEKFSKEWLERMGKQANSILSLNSPIENID